MEMRGWGPCPAGFYEPAPRKSAEHGAENYKRYKSNSYKRDGGTKKNLLRKRHFLPESYCRQYLRSDHKNHPSFGKNSLACH